MEEIKKKEVAGPRMSLQTLKVLHVFTLNPTSDHYGLEIANKIGVKGGTLYPILMRLESHGWLESNIENIDPKVAGRRPRRYYRITSLGLKESRKVLQEVPDFTQLNPALVSNLKNVR